MGVKGLFGGCFADEEAERREREEAIARARAQGVTMPSENDALKGASVVGDASFQKQSPWEEERREYVKQLREEQRKQQAGMKREASKPADEAGADRKKPDANKKKNIFTQPGGLFASFRQKFDDKARNPDAVAEDELKPKSEYERPKTIKKEDSVAAWKQKFESERLSSTADDYKSEYEKEKEKLPTMTLEDRQKEIEKREAEKLMTDQFKVEVGLNKARYTAGSQPKGAKVRRLQHDLAGSTYHFHGVAKNQDLS